MTRAAGGHVAVLVPRSCVGARRLTRRDQSIGRSGSEGLCAYHPGVGGYVAPWSASQAKSSAPARDFGQQADGLLVVTAETNDIYRLFEYFDLTGQSPQF